MSHLQKILKWTMATVFATFGLLTFTLLNRDKLVNRQILGCATVAINNDVYPKRISIEHPGLQIFQDYCKTCHRLDQQLVGPALRYSFKTRDSIWFVKMIADANGLINSGDTLAVTLFNDYNQLQHPAFTGLTDEKLAELVAYLKLEGQKEIVIE